MPTLLYSSGRDSTMFYNVRLEIPDPFFFLDLGEKKYIFLDHREYGVFEESNTNPAIELVALESLYDEIKNIPGEGPGAGKLGLVILQKYGVVDAEIFVPATFPLYVADFLRSRGVTLTPKASLYPERVTKSAREVEAVRRSLLATQAAFMRIENILAESVIRGNQLLWQEVPLTSEILKVEAEKVLLEQDMMNVEGIIISCGSQAAIPHHRGSGEIRPHQSIVCDIFPRNRATGFFADMTRTYIKGEPSPELQKMFDAVLEVQTSAINAVKSGVTFGSIHNEAVKSFLAKGYHKGPEGFTHSIGHGLGLDVHELPFARDEEVLRPGHVITVEPGLYYKNIGGVRIEDVVLVTETGYENLTEYSNRWIIP